ncbi:hypothetical protein Zmor_016450 [Zophobas morio]|uniref:Protein kinase domain-containing protein n=1 Tax=Zophobas morio TaxID=2755281 RepID=A0AA38HL22_9CUCU|nr:hypothetical protein Zmor_016450 [Zophobas morio]
MDSNLANCDFLKQQFFDSASPLNIDSLLDAFNFLSTQTAKPKYRGQQRVEVFNNRYNLSLKNAVNLCLKIDDFVNLKAIGKGEFGEVRLVKFKQTGECFAMKILNKSTITRRMDEACFFEERDVMVQVKSPFIVNLNYAFQDELNLYIIMDFLPGGDLWQMLINTAEEWTEEWTRFYMAELLVALEDLHKTGYMHRDVKPENIMIDANGHFKLTDFGSSAKIPLKGFLDANTVAVGTPCYVAPEVNSK